MIWVLSHDYDSDFIYRSKFESVKKKFSRWITSVFLIFFIEKLIKFFTKFFTFSIIISAYFINLMAFICN